LDTILNLGISLGDNITSGLAGFVLYDSWKVNRIDLSDIESKLAVEGVDIGLSMGIKKLVNLIA
jgi:hypothetical protein